MKPTNDAEKEALAKAKRKRFIIMLITAGIIAAAWIAFAIWDSQTGGFNGPLPIKVNFDSIQEYINTL